MPRRYARAVRRVVMALSAFVVILPIWGCGSSTSSSGERTARTSPAPGPGAGATQSAPTRSTSSGRPGRTAIPILMYHVIASPPPSAPFPGLYVAPEEFAAQMQALKTAGWHAVTLDQVEAFW